MRRVYEVLAVMLFLGLMGGSLYLLFWISSKAISYFAGFESEFAAALVATAGTIIIGMVTLVLTLRESKRREIREAHRAQKVDVYKRFMDTAVVDLLRQVSEGHPLSEQEMSDRYKEFFLTFTADLIVWGSPGVIRAFRDFRRAANVGDKKIILTIDDILREIRKDLGNSNWQINSGDLMSTFMSDPDGMQTLLNAQTTRIASPRASGTDVAN